MQNVKDAETSPFSRILGVGKTGSGKSSQFWTLPGKKFCYVFDPNSMRTFKRVEKNQKLAIDMDVEFFLPDVTELDATLKKFNKSGTSDRLASKREPTVYMRWVEDINKRVEEGFFDSYDWLGFDSMTFLVKAVMDRQLYINNRYGDIEELGDYRVVGSKLTEVFNSICGMDINIYATGHINEFENDKTKKIETLLNLPGKARNIIPLMFTDIWLFQIGEDQRGNRRHEIRTVPEKRGLQEIRTSFIGLKDVEDVTIEDFTQAEQYGIGALLQRYT